MPLRFRRQSVFMFTHSQRPIGTLQEIHALIRVIEFDHRSLGFDFITPLAVSLILGSGETSFSEATYFREADYIVCQCISQSTAKKRRSEPLADQDIPHHHHFPFSWCTRPHTHYSARNSQLWKRCKQSSQLWIHKVGDDFVLNISVQTEKKCAGTVVLFLIHLQVSEKIEKVTKSNWSGTLFGIVIQSKFYY